MKRTRTTFGTAAALALLAFVLVPACKGKPGDGGEAPAAGKAAEGTVALSPEAVRTAGIRTEEARFRSFRPAVKASGTVALNQKAFIRVTPRVAGRIENVSAFEGDRVRAGQELFRLWSPELMAAQAEYLQILARDAAPAGSVLPEEARLQEGLVKSGESRLRLMGFAEEDLAALRAGRQALPYLAVRAPFAGTVVEVGAAAGSAVEPGAGLAAVADLSVLWVQVNLFEKDLGAVAPGAFAEVEVAAYPDQVFPGTLVSVGALMDETTRTVKARVEVPNPGRRLKPGMFADVRIVPKDPVTALVVPEAAVRTISGRAVVFLPGPAGTFLRRDVQKGREFEGFIEILDGLKEGDRVVTDGSFAVKSEMLKGALEGEK